MAGRLPLHAQQGEPGRPLLQGSAPARTSTGQGPEEQTTTEQENQVFDVNGIGVNFTLVNAVGAANGDATENQGERTDLTLDTAIFTNTANAGGVIGGGGTDARGQLEQREQNGGAATLFRTPNWLAKSAAAFEGWARHNTKIIPMQDVDAGVAAHNLGGPRPKSWYVISGGPFEGVWFETTTGRFVRTMSAMQIAVLADLAQASLTSHGK
eukprot:2440610-Pleurochrysis_carterae.AAC.10